MLFRRCSALTVGQQIIAVGIHRVVRDRFDAFIHPHNAGIDNENAARVDGGGGIDWKIKNRIDTGVAGVRRQDNSLQKDWAIIKSTNLLTVWRMGSVGAKEKLQKLFFPEGLAYDKEIGAFRTNTINSLIAVIARLSGDSLLVETQKALNYQGQSHLAGNER